MRIGTKTNLKTESFAFFENRAIKLTQNCVCCFLPIRVSIPLFRLATLVNPPCVQNVPGKNGELSPGNSLHPRESDPKFIQGPGDVTTSPTLLGRVLVWSQQNYLRLLLIVRYIGSS